jgi:hypothetical protein
MKLTKLCLALIALLTLGLGSEAAFAHGGGHVGVYFGFPFVGPGYYGPYYGYGPYYSPYYYPPVAAVPAGPTTYVEQSQTQPVPDQAPPASWYYCAASKTYYPYVKQCSSGWQQVAPQPPSQQ